jgi:hypothetical protein
VFKKILVVLLFSVMAFAQEAERADLVKRLREGDIKTAMKYFNPLGLQTKRLAHLDKVKLQQLAFWIENAQLTQDSPNYKTYRYVWKNKSGEPNSVEFGFERCNGNAVCEQGKWFLSNL